MLGLGWDPQYIRTWKGMAMLSQVIVGAVGGVISFIAGARFEQFIFWSVLIITGVLLFTQITNLTNIVEAKIPYLGKLRLGYLVVWCGLIGICLVIEFFTFITSLIYILLNFGLLLAMGVDLAITWRSGGAVSGNIGGSTSTENLESEHGGYGTI
eukprot:TRINITY_DN14399_c0_g1_i10.p1 TRINITY_DN14399_c0_g1~~TRINITY_DN14399_c0_g1_i10.p1  ORF type:complete len:155 (-),score=1.14 TRINITY_DN14399_c0_g1_i10:413-877(-)